MHVYSSCQFLDGKSFIINFTGGHRSIIIANITMRTCNNNTLQMFYAP